MSIEREIISRLEARKTKSEPNLDEVIARSIEHLRAEARRKDETMERMVRNAIEMIESDTATREIKVEMVEILPAREIMTADVASLYPELATDWQIR